jgi:hypothetical protein
MCLNRYSYEGTNPCAINNFQGIYSMCPHRYTYKGTNPCAPNTYEGTFVMCPENNKAPIEETQINSYTPSLEHELLKSITDQVQITNKLHHTDGILTTTSHRWSTYYYRPDSTYILHNKLRHYNQKYLLATRI